MTERISIENFGDPARTSTPAIGTWAPPSSSELEEKERERLDQEGSVTERAPLAGESVAIEPVEARDIGSWTPPPTDRPETFFFIAPDGERMIFEIVEGDVSVERLNPAAILFDAGHSEGTRSFHWMLLKPGEESDALMQTMPEIDWIGSTVRSRVEIARLRLRRIA